MAEPVKGRHGESSAGDAAFKAFCTVPDASNALFRDTLLENKQEMRLVWACTHLRGVMAVITVPPTC